MVAVTGPVGCGKSSLLLALCGELRIQKGHLVFGSDGSTTTGVAYCGQEAWLQQGTVRQNVLFGTDFDETWYSQVVSACALLPDFEVCRRLFINSK